MEIFVAKMAVEALDIAALPRAVYIDIQILSGYWQETLNTLHPMQDAYDKAIRFRSRSRETTNKSG